jgi:hypothetical protein
VVSIVIHGSSDADPNDFDDLALGDQVVTSSPYVFGTQNGETSREAAINIRSSTPALAMTPSTAPAGMTFFIRDPEMTRSREMTAMTRSMAGPGTTLSTATTATIPSPADSELTG